MSLFHSPSLVTSGLVLCLDAGNTKSYPGSGTTWTDLSGNGNTGTLTNGPTYSSANGGSIVFDGTDDSVVAASPIVLAGDFATSLWLNLNSQNYNVFTFGDTTVPYGYMQIFQAGGWYLRTSETYLGLGHGTINNGQWYNYALTRAGSAVSFYKDGVLLGSGTLGGTSTPSVIGRGTAAGFLTSINGRISSAVIYNRALSAAEVRQNFNALRGRYGV